MVWSVENACSNLVYFQLTVLLDTVFLNSLHSAYCQSAENVFRSNNLRPINVYIVPACVHVPEVTDARERTCICMCGFVPDCGLQLWHYIIVLYTSS